MATCPGCGKKGFRKGNTVTLQDPAAGPGGRRARVCSECEGGALKVVAPRMAARALPKAPNDQEAVEAMHRVIRQLNTLSKAEEAAEKRETQGSPEANFHGGKSEGFSGAIELVKREFASIHARGLK